MALHTANLVFSAIALLSMYALSQNITGHGLYGSLILLATPAFLLSSHTVMADTLPFSLYISTHNRYLFVLLRLFSSTHIEGTHIEGTCQEKKRSYTKKVVLVFIASSYHRPLPLPFFLYYSASVFTAPRTHQD